MKKSMTKIIERFFNDEDSFNHSLEANISCILSKAVQERGKATFLVSGGSTPQLLYHSLSDNTDLFWNQIQVAMVDERWVCADNDLSNERFIRRHLLRNNAKDAKFLAMKTTTKVARDAEREINQEYATLKTPFDVTILGMGNDGHTASLFPNAEGLERAITDPSAFCRSIQAQSSEATGEITERMSLTLHGLLQSKIIFLLLRGKEKLATYHQAMNGNDIFEMPVRAILQQKDIPVIVNWAP